jgi:ABC-2 type transport system ATP-binding protein
VSGSSSSSTPWSRSRRRARLLAELAVGEVVVEEHSRRLVAPVSGGGSTLVEVLRRLDAAGLTVLDVALRRPTWTTSSCP